MRLFSSKRYPRLVTTFSALIIQISSWQDRRILSLMDKCNIVTGVKYWTEFHLWFRLRMEQRQAHTHTPSSRIFISSQDECNVVYIYCKLLWTLPRHHPHVPWTRGLGSSRPAVPWYCHVTPGMHCTLGCCWRTLEINTFSKMPLPWPNWCH